MVILVTGSRKFTDYDSVYRQLAIRMPSLVIHGGAAGADSLAGKAASALGIPVRVFPAQWRSFGRRAGFLRNSAMVSSGPDLVLAFFSGHSPGTSHCVSCARDAGIPVLSFGNPGFVSQLLLF